MSLQTVGRYKVVQQIGRGAMGEVWKAHDPLLNRFVALKTMSPRISADPDLRRRFEREAQSAAALNHPHIVTVFELVDEGGRIYIAMELLDGRDLKDLIESRAVRRLDDRLAIIDQMLDGLAFAHEQGVLHRDLKPANLRMLSTGQLKIMDFGLARIVTGAEMTRAGTVLGTPNYMSPEQVRGQKSDTRSDVFAAGAVAYELLTGRKAFEAPNTHAVLQKVVEAVPTPIARLAADVPAAVAAVVDKALAKDPAQRFGHAGEMRAALQAAWPAPLSRSSIDLRALAGSRAGTGEAGLPTVAMLRDSVAGSAALDPTLLAGVRAEAGTPMQATLAGSAETAMAGPRPPRRGLWIGGGVAALLAVAVGTTLLVSRTGPPTPAPAAVQDARARMVAQQLAQSQAELAAIELQNKEYERARTLAQDALRVDAANTSAQDVLARTEAFLRQRDEAARSAQDAIGKKDLAGAAAAFQRLLGLDPRHPAVPALSAALNASFRSQAEEARTAMNGVRAQARGRALQGQPVYQQAEGLAREAEGLLRREEFAVATQRFVQARDAFDRSLRAAQEQAARQAQAQAQAEATRPAPPPTVVAQLPPPSLSIPTVAPTIAPTAPPTAAPAPPSAAPGSPAAVSGAAHETAIRRVIDDYKRAIEGKDLLLYRAVRPNVTDQELKRLQDVFRAVKSQQVNIRVESVEVSSTGTEGTVRATTQMTVNGQAMKPLSQVFSFVRGPEGWVIRALGQ
jgi:tetratricopeptide (TPR) repeat protein